MSESFSVGEIAIYVRLDSDCYGREIRIVGGLEKRELLGCGLVDSYAVEHPDGLRHPLAGWIALPEHLRKRRPPMEDETLDTVTPLKIVRWTDCPWQPRKVTR